ncbi:MAG: TolC family protein [Pirellulaceae bacterium]|nr:TolC family protein [Pirellulaceae bacterium]
MLHHRLLSLKLTPGLAIPSLRLAAGVARWQSLAARFSAGGLAMLWLLASFNSAAHAQWIKSAQMGVNQTFTIAPADGFSLAQDGVLTQAAALTQENSPSQDPPIALSIAAPINQDGAGNQLDAGYQAGVSNQVPGELSGRVVACQAACCHPLAKLLEQRAATIMSESQRCNQSQLTSLKLQANFLRRQAAWQRDVAAANALRAYYAWIANREQLRIVADGLKLHRDQLQVQAALIAKGVAIPDPTALDRQRLELVDSQLQLQAAERQLASGLSQLTCCATDIRMAAVESLDIQTQPIDCEALIRIALERRQDYLAIVQLCHCLDEESARAIAQLLTPLVGVGLNLLDLGIVEKLCFTQRGIELVQQVKRELQLASQAQRMRIEQSVCEKCHALTLAYERVSVASQVIESWENRLAALARLEELGDARGEAQTTARAELIRAQATLTTRRLSAKLAEVDLAEAVGGLASRCCRGEAWLVTGASSQPSLGP